MLYYFLVVASPPLTLTATPEITFKELKDLLFLNLTDADFASLRLLLRTIDLYNLRAFWLSQPLDERGNWNAKELEEALLVRDLFPSYLIDFLDRYETVPQRLKAFPSLIASLFREEEKPLKGFLHAYYKFERERMLVLTALRAKATGRDVVQELQFESHEDPLVNYILAQKDASEFIPPQEFEDLKILFVEKEHNPEKLNRAILEYRLKKIEEMEEQTAVFSIGRVLGYVARFLIVENWAQLNREKGRIEVAKLSEYE